ncbi:MAG: hypothetical protein CMC76_10285 [Flavobacteriaceae bacterium]|nr:hypothetical protein [Flavobacteriaceae bacterium]|tara:strand:+ start:578 stop:1036 length:459 start_codon:yes stop_codon:yes gene_type:complete
MKKIMILVGILLVSCQNKNTSVTEDLKLEFEKVAKEFQQNYIEGSDHCKYIIRSVDKEAQISEIQFGQPKVLISYEQLAEFCPQLSKKIVVDMTSEQRLLTPSLGYDYVRMTYLRESHGDTVQRISSRIWKVTKGTWKIIQIDNSLSKVCDD